jgi:hypothetical protein
LKRGERFPGRFWGRVKTRNLWVRYLKAWTAPTVPRLVTINKRVSRVRVDMRTPFGMRFFECVYFYGYVSNELEMFWSDE